MHNRIGSGARWFARAGSLAAALALSACGGGGSDGGTTPTGTLKLSMTDAPACYQSVVVNVAKVRVHTSDDGGTPDGDGGWREIVPPNAPVQIDLLNLTNGRLAELGQATVPAGRYKQLRLVLANNGNTVTPVGAPSPEPLTTPSGQQSGLKIKVDFDVLANQTSDLLMDFDACKSIVLTGSGKYLLKPVVRLSQKPTGTIQGFVSTSVAEGTTTVTLGSIGVSAQQNGSVVRSTSPDSSGKFTLAYLPVGTYTVVITGDGSTNGAATRVVDSVPVGTATVSLNTGTSTIVLNSSPMRTVTGTITPSASVGTTTISDNASVAAMQTVNSRLVEVNSTVPNESLGYSLRVPVGPAEYQLFSAGGLPAPSADPSTAGQYNIRLSGPGLPTKEVLEDANAAPDVVNFAY